MKPDPGDDKCEVHYNRITGEITRLIRYEPNDGLEGHEAGCQAFGTMLTCYDFIAECDGKRYDLPWTPTKRR